MLEEVSPRESEQQSLIEGGEGKSFVVGKVKWAEDSEALCLEVEMRPRANGHPICSGCGEKAPGYDQSRTPRRFEFVPMWMICVIFLDCMRRVNCPTCGVKVERVPWAEGKSPLTTEYKWFLARWARRMSWKEVSEAFRVSWDSVYTAVKQAVSWGLEHRDLEGIEAIGVDEVQWHKGHQYQTVVYQLDEGRKRLLWIGLDRKSKTLLRFFRFLGKERTAGLHFICSDMWRAYLKVIAKKAPQAVHVLDRFHIMQKMSKALDKVRAAEVKQLKADGYEPVLKGARWFVAEGQLSSGIVEGFNNKLKLITRKSYGFRTQEAYETALYHTLGALPEPKSTHEFC